jgi:hypothetical protein
MREERASKDGLDFGAEATAAFWRVAVCDRSSFWRNSDRNRVRMAIDGDEASKKCRAWEL